MYFDGDVYWLADGFHRLRAIQQIGRDSITATVHQGGQRNAILHAVGANETHGLRRTNADRRQAVMLLLNDPEWSQWSNHAIARQCMVSEISVRRVRRELEPKGEERAKDETRKAERRGKVYTIHTEAIGAAKKKQPKAPVGTDGKDAEPPAVAAETTQEPVVLQEPPDALSMTMSQIDTSVPTTTAPVPTLLPETAPVTSAEPDPDGLQAVVEAPSSAVSVLSAAAAAELSLEDAWEWATQTDREGFVGNHRDELQKIFKKLEKSAAS